MTAERITTAAELDVLRTLAERLVREDAVGLGLSRGEGALGLALCGIAKAAIEDVYADCGDTDPEVLASNVAGQIAHDLERALPDLLAEAEARGAREVATVVLAMHPKGLWCPHQGAGLDRPHVEDCECTDWCGACASEWPCDTVSAIDARAEQVEVPRG